VLFGRIARALLKDPPILILILVFEGGRIVETGIFEELVGRSGRFMALAKAQFIVPEPAGHAPKAASRTNT